MFVVLLVLILLLRFIVSRWFGYWLVWLLIVLAWLHVGCLYLLVCVLFKLFILFVLLMLWLCVLVVVFFIYCSNALLAVCCWLLVDVVFLFSLERLFGFDYAY